MVFGRQQGPKGGQQWAPRVALLVFVVLVGTALSKQNISWGDLSQGSFLVRMRSSCVDDAAVGDGVRADPDAPVPGELWPGTMPMAQPSKATFDRLQADPGLAERDPAVVAEFEAMPWLLPPRTKALDYAGVHDLDRLLELRSRPAGNFTKAVVLLLFSKNISVMAQNGVYGLVKLGGVRNLVAAAWSPPDLEACADLNLPCADMAGLLPEPLEQPAAPTEKDKKVIKWLRAVAAARAVRQGYAVVVADADAAWTTKPVWESFLGFAATSEADAVFPEKYHAGGAFLVLPTPPGTAFSERWAAAAKEGLGAGQDDQGWLGQHEDVLRRCSHPGCVGFQRDEARKAGKEGQVGFARSYHPGFRLVSPEACLLDRPDAPLLDYCDWAILHVHPSCTALEGKAAVYKRQGLWLMDDEGGGCTARPGAASGVLACQPLRWRVPDAEQMFYECSRYGTGLWHVRPPLRLPPAAADSAGGAANAPG